MNDLLPKGEELRRAVKWMSDHMEQQSDTPLHKLVDEAVFKFDLSPKDADFLIEFYHQALKKKDS
ncbi:hypothetical protein [Geoalkalibacter halelectricus]|uniref:Uncharacterized protein n=1 Tax=Geoalkalibacter halelectricus TaxID=2847045 RepID=A0ABY5ZPC0_9BACT|nr:hypothetical protein [Geoalkalibacter halelectricus]MDO3379242.1 hypothetical protein [Geoalkalibacter halelectricus]UWZ81000.1 hypothetical protein L9S41_06290 [Geoalkalibacter halelectricus]